MNKLILNSYQPTSSVGDLEKSTTTSHFTNVPSSSAGEGNIKESKSNQINSKNNHQVLIKSKSKTKLENKDEDKLTKEEFEKMKSKTNIVLMELKKKYTFLEVE